MRFDFVFYVDGDFEILQNILRYESSLRGLRYSENLSKDIDCYKYVFGVEMEPWASGAEENGAGVDRGKNTASQNNEGENDGDESSKNEIPLQDGEPNPLLEFANTLAQKIPLSLKFRFSSIESVAQDEDSAGQPKPPKGESARKSPQDAAPTIPNSTPALNEPPASSKHPPLDAQTITQIIKNQDLHQMQKYLSATSFVHEGEEREFAQALDFIQEELESQKPVVLHTSRGKIAISALPFDAYTDAFGALFESSSPRSKAPTAQAKPPKVLFWNLSTLRTYMRAEAAQCDALASYEKPSMMLSTKEVFSEALGREVECVLAYDLFLGVLGERCSAGQMDYVFVRELDSALGLNGEADWVSNLPYHIAYTQEVPQEERVVLAQNGLVLYCGESRAQSLQEIIHAHGDLLDEAREPDGGNGMAQNLEGANGVNQPPPQKSRLQKAREERLGGKIAEAKNSSGAQETRRLEGNEALIVSLSRDNPMCFWLKSGEKYQSALNAEFELNARLVFEGIASYKDGDKLLANFRCAVPQIDAHLESFGQASQKSRNIFAFLGVVARVLGYGEDAHALLENAKGYVRDKGPRIDYKLVKSPQNILSLDYPKILRSCMSFYLAGVDRETLSYGVLDSLGEFVGNLMQDLCVNFAARKILLCGNLLEEKILLDKILHYAPRDVRLILPKKGYLDYP